MSAIKFTAEELAAFRQEYAKGATDSQFTLFISECERRGLRPGAHLVFQLRNAKEYDPAIGASVFVKKPYWITTISALLLIAERTGKYDGASAPEYIYLDDDGVPSIVSEIPLPDKNNRTLPREPWAVRVKIRRKDFSEPIVSVVRFDSVAATMKRDNSIVLTEMWQKRPGEQCAKCALANGIRIGFPEEAGHLFLSEEIKSEEEPVAATAVTPASVVPILPSAPAVNQTPAEATDKPRPGEIGQKTGQSAPERAVKPQENNSLDSAKETAKSAVPDLKPASELPKPKKRGRKPKEQPTVEGITQADIDSAGQAAPEFDKAANQREAQEFVEAVTSFTEEQAKEAGLPPPPDPLPSADQLKEFVARARKLAEPGADIKKLGDYTLGLGKKTASKYLTVGDWTTALGNLEKAKAEGKLKELVNSVPEPPLGEF